jgi:predicted ABC-type ATPase
MPYFITDTAEGCSGWATVKEDGEVIGCHTTKKQALDQMVAVSLAEDMEPGGERALNDELEVGDYVFWDNAGQTMFGEIISVSTFGAVKNPLGGDIVATQGRPLATIQVYLLDNGVLIETNEFVVKGFAPLTKIDYQGQDEMQDESDDETMDSLRIESGPLAVIVDIDDTLIRDGQLIEKTYAYIDDMEDTEIFIVTGRNVSQRDETVAQLDSLGVDYDRLFMNPGSSADTPAFKKATAEKLLQVYNVIIAIDNNPANRRVYRELGITALDVSDVPDVPSDQNNPDEERLVNQDAPAYMRAAARRGLEYYADGKGGDGLVDKTIREARLMADGQVSDDKWIRTAAWIARHLGDLDSPDADPNSDNYPSAGVVAHLLWGSGPSKARATAAMEYAQRVAERIRNEERHLPGKHDQKSHGHGGKSAGINPETGQGNIKITSDMASEWAGTSAGAHLRQNQDGSYAFTPERQALHDKIVSDALSGVPTSTDPTYHVMGGGPAAGKSTMLKNSKVDVPAKDKAVQINADDVKEKLPEWDRMDGDPNRANYLHEESSYLAKRIQAAGFETRKDVVVDGTGDSSESSMTNKISKARAAGYKVKGNYATTSTEEAVQRANARGKRTGRYVPEPVIRKTHAGVSEVFPKITGLFDEISLWDTSGELKLLASGKNGKFTVNDQDGYNSFLAKAGE